MIPRASARRLETTLVSYSRQSLPRPARFYSTPTKSAYAPALAQVSSPDLGFGPIIPKTPPVEPVVNDDLQRFLGRRPQFTMLPTPLPDDKSSALNDFYFPDSPTQDLVAVMDACMHNLYDVPRATQIFEKMRTDKPGEPLLDVRVYNSFLETFIEMATIKEQDEREFWVKKAWTLFSVMEEGEERVVPTAGTYATMLIAWLRYVEQIVQCIYFHYTDISSQIPRRVINARYATTSILTQRHFIPCHRPRHPHHDRCRRSGAHFVKRSI
jgi:DNA-directed RNA polymerase, mitochondrial